MLRRASSGEGSDDLDRQLDVEGRDEILELSKLLLGHQAVERLGKFGWCRGDRIRLVE
jgi:hypothetical protein